MFEDIRNVLKLRKEPQAPEHLSAQIIAAAARMGQVPLGQVDGRPSLWQELKEMFAVPQPALAMAFTLVFGLVAGFLIDGASIFPEMTTDDLGAFMAINDGFVAGEFL